MSSSGAPFFALRAGLCLAMTTGIALASAALGSVDCGGTGGSANATSGDIKVQINGEAAAYSGIPFPEGGIVDGWQLQFEHVLFAFDKVTLSDNPDKAPSDQSQLDSTIAELDGPWIVDLAIPGTETGADGASRAVLVDRIHDQNKNGNASFDATVRYGFSYESVLATNGAKRLNLNAEGEPYLAEMVGKYSVLYVGTATWKGDASCKSSNPSYYGASFPTTFRFELGFATPTRYSNCQNQNNQGEPLSGENYQRGIQVVPNGETLAQMTIHLDHVMFDDVSHDAALYFDQFAAALVGKPAGTVLHTEDLKGIDPTALTDAAGNALAWRTCDGTDPPPGAQRSVQTESIPVDPSSAPQAALRDYFDFVQYVQSTQGHLNGGDGLCFIERRYPAPP